MVSSVSSPPSSEIGYVVPGTTPGWNYFSSVGAVNGDTLEEVAELAWPNNIRVFHRMRTDAQIDALISSVVKPLLRLKWQLNPNGARPEVLADISQQLNLPIKGDTGPFIQRGRKRFDHAEHLRLALLAPTVYGHMPFEMQGDIGADLKWHLSKLMPVMPHTISKMTITRQGGLESITQYGDAIALQPVPIPITQLAMYTWEREGGNWAGRSMMRPLYRYWMLKDRMLRIDAMANERYGLGIPVGTAAPGGDPASMQKMASSVRAVEEGGVGLPNGATLGVQGITGSLPDTKGSIKLYNEEMAKSFLAMFMGLGQAEHGSRALGESFVDFFVDALAAFANWYTNITNQHVIEDIVDWNWGEDENAPLLEWSERDEQPLSIEDLANLIRSGGLVVDAELQEWIRKRLSMPEYKGQPPLPTRPGDPATDPQSTGAEEGKKDVPDPVPANPATPVKAARRPMPYRRDTQGQFAVDTLELPYGRTENSTKVRFLGARGCRHVAAATVTDYVGHRQPNAQEIQASTDFQKLQKQWTEVTSDIVEQWGEVRAGQIDALYAAIETAVDTGNYDVLSNLVAPVAGVEQLVAHMESLAKDAIVEAKAEAVSQGLTHIGSKTYDIANLGLEKRAQAVARMMANDLGQAATRNVLLRYGADSGLTGAEVATGVRTQLEALGDGYLNDTLGGAMTQAQNSGRREVMDDAKGPATTFYASELLDNNTCDACSAEDGTPFTDLSAANFDYPVGGFYDCAGGPRCRGTVIAVYGESPT